MKNQHSIMIIFILGSIIQNLFAAEGTLLEDLSNEFKSLREFPANTNTSSRCPENNESLIGLTRLTIIEYFGVPDWPIEGYGSYNKDEIITYIFRAGRTDDKMGGGNPELSFYFDNDEKIYEVECHYSR